MKSQFQNDSLPLVRVETLYDIQSFKNQGSFICVAHFWRCPWCLTEPQRPHFRICSFGGVEQVACCGERNWFSDRLLMSLPSLVRWLQLNAFSASHFSPNHILCWQWRWRRRPCCCAHGSPLIKEWDIWMFKLFTILKKQKRLDKSFNRSNKKKKKFKFLILRIILTTSSILYRLHHRHHWGQVWKLWVWFY